MKEFIENYLNSIKTIIEEIDIDNIHKIIDIFIKTYKEKKKIFVFGNGGSAATANHFTCDLGKNAIKDSMSRFKIISLSN